MSRRRGVAFSSKKIGAPPDDQPWCWYSLEMLTSAAFRGMPPTTRKFIEYLEIEHMVHGGYENGRLKAPHRALQAFGIRAGSITTAIADAEDRRLVEITQRALYRGHGHNSAASYRLTFRPTWQKNEFGRTEKVAPTDEWRQYRKATKETDHRVVANES